MGGLTGEPHRSQKGEKQGRRRRWRGAATRSRERGLGLSFLRSPQAAKPATPDFGLPACKRWSAVCCLQPRSLGNVPVFQQPWKQTPTVLETVTGAPATRFRFHPHDTDRRKHSQLFSPDHQTTHERGQDRPSGTLFPSLSATAHCASIGQLAVPCCLVSQC